MGIGKIVEGHAKEAFGINEELKDKRLSICRNCPLYTETGLIGPMCSPYLYVNPETEDVSTRFKTGYIRGCGCRLNAKARLKDAKCPLDKWK